MPAKVIEIQVGGWATKKNLEEACREYVRMIEKDENYRSKIIFVIELPSGELKQITIRDEDEETVAYGDFEGLPSALDYARELYPEKAEIIDEKLREQENDQ